MSVFLQMEKGEDITGLKAGEVSGGQVTVDLNIKDGKRIVVAEIDKIG